MTEFATPYFIVYEDLLRKNIELIVSVAEKAGVEIIMAFKANALWRTFPLFRQYGVKSTASSYNEMRLGVEELGERVHSYCPVYTESNIGDFIKGSSHITFNSLEQFNRFYPLIEKHNGENGSHRVSAGLRVNPRCEVVETDIYNPALPGSRFGVTAGKLPEKLPGGLEGFHFHQLCESSAEDLAKVLEAFESQFGAWLPQLKWVNMGGGHLMTREGYDTERLIALLRDFRNRHPHIKVILEPGSAWTWRSGNLVTSVMDVVKDSGIKTAIIDASFACHMPDTLEMPYKPVITEAEKEVNFALPTYRLGGNSCLSGDYKGDWSFTHPLRIGDRLTLEDMNHYTTVKTNMFNGIQHPDILYARSDGRVETLRHFTYDDYKSRMD